MRRLLPFLALGALVAGVHLAGVFEPLERQFADTRFQWIERPARGGVVVVAIDPRSLSVLDVWPWDRGLHATLLEQLLEAGARRVAFDIDFSSRSRDPVQDVELAGALDQARGRVVLPAFHQRERTETGSRLSTTRPIEPFRRHALPATINILPDADGLVRRYRTRDAHDGDELPSLAVALADVPRPEFDEFHLDFGIDPDSIPRVSYIDVLTGRFDTDSVRDRAVIIGATAVELGDQVAVPLRASLAGPLLQALAFESLVQGRALQPAPRWLTLLLTLAVGLLVGPWLSRSSWRAGLAIVVALIVAMFALSVAAQAWAPVLIDTTPWMIVTAGAFALAVLSRTDQQALRIIFQALRLRRTETLMRHVVDNSFDAILTVDAKHCVETVNPAAEAMFGCPSTALVGRSIHDLVGAHEQDEPGAWMQAGEPREAVGVREGGERFPLELAINAIADDSGDRHVCFLRDITQRKAQEQALEHQATHDALTRLPNRVLLRARMEQALRSAERSGATAALMVLDLDRFKEVNDTLGHHVGDVLLQQIGERISRPLRDSDTIARFGGDEFAILLPESTLETAREMGERIIATLAEPLHLQGLALQVDASVGIAMYPEHGLGAMELVQRADVAMYMAKREHRGVAVYDPEEDFTSVRNLTLSSELRDAIKEDQLFLCYQPKVSCATDRLVGVEALVRWQHPVHGMLPPFEFIALAEHCGLIKPLSTWVIRTALRQCAEWRGTGLDIAMAINISARNLQEEDLPQQLARVLDEYRVPPRLLTLEITESVIMENPERAMQVVTQFAALGVNIAIDDFGTGYSSLAYLKRLPAREIKIDRAFVAEVDRDKDDAIIVRSTIEMAHNLGLKVVAEGIENESTWSELKSFGCNEGQGYFFSKPLPADELVRWLASSRWRIDPAGGRGQRVSVA